MRKVCKNLNKRQLIKLKKRRKEENINVKKEQKTMQKMMKRKFKKEIKKQNSKPDEKISNMSRKKKMRNEIIISWMALIALLFRIGWIQFGMGSELQAKAYVQQTLDRSINPRRGTIYDSTETTILAVSSTVETVTVNPVNIKKEDKEKVAKALSNIFELDYEKVYKKVNKRSSIETIVKKIDKEKSNELRTWLQENNITSGINIDEDTKRYYPYNNLASQIIGFSGSDNQGLDGIEAIYDEQLKGTKGKIQKLTDATGGDIEKSGENYVEAVDGEDLVLTIDATIQGIAEKYLKEACIDNKCTDGGNIVVMNPKTGDVLAIAGYPNYNLNEPFEPSTDELKQEWNSMSQADKNKAMLSLWRNKAVTDTYEPGSTFKIITTAAALEQGVVTVNDSFYCPGYKIVEDRRIRCHKTTGHGAETFTQGIMNSCNPVFIQVGLRLGVDRYYRYFRKFGLLTKTGVDLPGEAGTIMHKKEDIGLVELATMSFGQSFQITPIQMATTVSSLVNGGKRVTPHFGISIEDGEGTVLEQFQYEEKKGIVSEKTSETMRMLLKSVVEEGSGRNGAVEGYSVGGKTATSQTLPRSANKYISSFIGFAPAENPQVLGIVVIRNPQGVYYGGTIAAPVLRSIYDNVLPYLGIEKS